MFNNLITRWIIILGVISGCIYILLPTFNLYTIKNDPDFQDIDIQYLEEDAIKLGLDLQGGLYTVLELDYKNYLLNYINNTISIEDKIAFSGIIESAIESAKNNSSDILSEVLILSDNNSISLKKIYSQFLINNSNTRTNLDIINLLKNNRDSAMASIVTIMRNRIENHNKYGVGEPSIQQYGSDRMIVELAGINDAEKAKEYIQRTAEFELTLVEDSDTFKELIFTLDKNNTYNLYSKILPLQTKVRDPYGNMKIKEEFFVKNEDIDSIQMILSSPNTLKIIHNKYKILWQDESKSDYPSLRQLHLLSINSIISSGEIQSPKARIAEPGSENAGQWYVSLDMNREGKIKWSRFTGDNIGRLVAIVLDKKVFMTPQIQAKISSGDTQITGFSGKGEAEDIASVLQAGELPAPIQIKQFNYIGPSLGEDSVEAGSFSMLLGLLLVIVFMIIYYNISGLIAAFALIINLIIVFAILVTMDAILTLPGLAGLLLTIGMTIDANIIIFERIREELSIGNQMKAAVINGYNRAFITILDANVTTLITASVLSLIGSGPIKGFATTLSVGILCSMFTAVFITKTIFLSMNKYLKVSDLKI